MVAILVTPELRCKLQHLNLEPPIETTNSISTISHKSLCKALRSCSNPPSLCSLLRLTSLHLSHRAAIQTLSPPTRNPEVECRVAKLRARLEELEYRNMTRDVARAVGSNAEVENLRLGKLAPQMSLGLNVVVSMATCFTAGYFVMKASTGKESVGLIGGVVGLILAMGVEAVLLVTRLYGIGKAVEEEGRKKERMREKGKRAKKLAASIE